MIAEDISQVGKSAYLLTEVACIYRSDLGRPHDRRQPSAVSQH